MPAGNASQQLWELHCNNPWHAQENKTPSNMKVVGQNIREKIQICAGILCPELSPLALVTLLRLSPLEKLWGKVQSCFRRPLKVWPEECDGLRGQPGAGTSWGCSTTAPSQGRGRAGGTHGAQTQVLGGEVGAGTAHHSWDWKITMWQCAIWINGDEMCCINTSGAWSGPYPLGCSGSQGGKVDLCL